MNSGAGAGASCIVAERFGDSVEFVNFSIGTQNLYAAPAPPVAMDQMRNAQAKAPGRFFA
jgi:hypothetical protein